MKLLLNKIVKLLLNSSLIFLILVKTSSAADVTFIEKDQKAPYAGLLFTESKAQSVRNELLELDKTRLLLAGEIERTKSMGSILELKEDEIELYRKQNQRLIRSEQTSDTMKYVWFGLGILATGVAVYGARGLAQQ